MNIAPFAQFIAHAVQSSMKIARATTKTDRHTLITGLSNVFPIMPSL
jgi:hypothetical protein